MHLTHMLPRMPECPERLLAHLTVMWPLSRMDQHMIPKQTFSFKSLSAIFTHQIHVGLCRVFRQLHIGLKHLATLVAQGASGMGQRVLGQLLHRGEHGLAHLAGVIDRSLVSLHVNPEITFDAESGIANVAGKGFLAGVHFQMQLQRCHDQERLSAEVTREHLTPRLSRYDIGGQLGVQCGCKVGRALVGA